MPYATVCTDLKKVTTEVNHKKKVKLVSNSQV